MRIAYVEDNAINLALVQRIATMSGHIITSYTEGETALVALSQETFDLIMMDVELAGELNGLQVVRALRARGLTTPIVAVTAYAMMGDREKCLEAGCNDYLPKPLPIAEFLALLAHYDTQIQSKKQIGVSVTAENSIVTTYPLATAPKKNTAPLADPGRGLVSPTPAPDVPKPGTRPFPQLETLETIGPTTLVPVAVNNVDIAQPKSSTVVSAVPIADNSHKVEADPTTVQTTSVDAGAAAPDQISITSETPTTPAS